MTYTTTSGTPVPQGTDAFNPNVQLKALADNEDLYNWSTSVATVIARDALAAPILRDGLVVTVRADDSLNLWDGAGWSVWDTDWQTYSPAVAGITVGNGTQTARYLRRGRTCVVDFAFVLGSTSAVSASVVIPPPLSALAPPASTEVVGQALFRDASPSTNYTGVVRFASVSAFDVFPQALSGTYLAVAPTSTTVPFTWTSTDYITARFEYELA
jgi:hypothetical protein